MVWTRPWQRFFAPRWWKLTFSKERRTRHWSTAQQNAAMSYSQRTGKPWSGVAEHKTLWAECFAQALWQEVYSEYKEGPGQWGANEVK